jgi:PAS domain S-box-containing protein
VIEKNYRHRNGDRLHASSNKNALRDENGRFKGVAAVVLDISDRVAAEQKIRDKEALLRKILDGTVAFIGVLEPDGTLIEANATALAAGGLEREEVIGRKFWDCHWWSHDPVVIDRLKAAVDRAARGSIERYDEVVRMRDDTRMTIDFMLAPLKGEDGEVHFLVPSGFDISDRKRQEARIMSLMHEVNHRSKNLLTVVQSIVRQMPKSTPDTFTQEFGRRLQALAACQDLLIRSGWENVPLETLIRSQLTHFADLLGARIALEGPPVTLKPVAAQTLGMAIYELTTNAAKYGALSNDAGRIRIAWSVETGPSGDRTFRLEWQERGGPEVVGRARTGFGSVVLNHLVGMTLEGECGMDLAPEGLSWRLRCAFEKLRAQ